MNCIRCGADAAFDRIVVGRQRPVFGTLCVACERPVLGAAGAVAGEDCAFCAERGAYAVPVWDAIGVSEADGSLQFLEYDIDPTTPRLCPDHYDELAAAPDGADDASVRLAADD